METLQIDILAIQETECQGQQNEQEITNNKGKKFTYYHTGKRKGVGFLLSSALDNATLSTITGRILRLKIEQKEKKPLIFYSVYCPIDTSETNEKKRRNEKFFKHLMDALQMDEKGSTITILGDFNCTLRKRHHQPPWIGQFALQNNHPKADKQKMNADKISALVTLHKLKIINTLTKKKIKHLSTYQPLQKLTDNRKIERELFVKDLILTNSNATKYKVIPIQAITHTPHHLLKFQLEEKRKTRTTQEKKKCYRKPLRRTHKDLNHPTLRDIDQKYSPLLKDNLKKEFQEEMNPEKMNINEVARTIQNIIQITCENYPEERKKKNRGVLKKR